MDLMMQRKGMDDLLAAIYGAQARLDSVLQELGFDEAQVAALEGPPLEAFLAGFVESLHIRLTSPTGLDTYFHVLSARFGLDGEPPRSLEAIAQSRGLDAADMPRLWGDILDHCKTKKMTTDLKKDLKRLAVEQLTSIGAKPDREHVAAKLERLSNLHEAADAARLDYESKRKEIMKKVQAELDALEVEYQPILDTVDENIEELANEIRTDVLLHGESVSGGAFRASYVKGRVIWDSRGMEGYAKKHPEVLEFRKEGDPNVTLRAVGAKE